MLNPPRNAHFEIGQMKKKVFLEGVLDRLKNDVGGYLDYVNGLSKTGVFVGFWGSVRLIMPVIEAVSYIYPDYRQKVPQFIKDKLGIRTPILAWTLFRHSLIHNDLIQHGHYNGVDASWGVNMMGQGHIIMSEHIGLDIVTLYNDLTDFVTEEIKNCNDTDEVNVIKGVMWDNPRQDIIDEFELLKVRSKNR